MIRKLILALTALSALTAAAEAQTIAALDRSHPKLKAQAVVTGSLVRIGDLIDNAGIVANVPIFRSPDLGSTGTVSAEAVIEAVRAHAIIGLDTGDVGEVVVTRAARTIEPPAIEQALTGALSAQFQLGPTKDIVLTFDRQPAPVYVEPAAKGEPRVSYLNYDPRTARFDAVVDLPGHAALRVSGRAHATVEVVTIARALNRGEVIKLADVAVERRPRAAVGHDAITKLDQAIGMAVRNAITPGTLLRTGELTKPQIVTRNEMVTLVYQVPGIMLTVRGKAMEGGAEGDTITVLNEQSKRTVQGVVVGPGRVVIGTTAPRLAANLAAAGDDKPSDK